MNGERYCHHCGASLTVGDKFCPNCGGGIVWVDASKVDQPPTTGTPVTQEFLAQQAAEVKLEEDKSKVIGCGAMLLAIGIVVFLYLIGAR